MFQHRVIQFDITMGQTPTLETVRRRVEWLQRYGLTGVLLYMESIVETRTFPCATAGKPPVTQEYLRELDTYCRSRGVTLIPLFQTLAHQDSILRLDAFQHLGELEPPRNRGGGNNFLPWHPEVRAKVAAWLDELLPLFEGPFVHLGCDEAWNLGTGRSREDAARAGVAPLLGDYLTFLDGVVRRHGKRMLMYADAYVDFPDLLPLVPRDVILVNWHYGMPDGCYEADNHHFAAHAGLHRCGHTVWGSGNNMAEYGLTPFYGLERNLGHWLELCRPHNDEGFLISDWFTRTSRLAPLLGEQYILMRLQEPALTLAQFLEALARDLLGGVDAAFVEGMTLLLQANWHPQYFGERLIYYGPLMGALMTEDPVSSGWMGRRFGALTRETLDRMLADLRRAEALLRRVRPPAAHADLLEDAVMIAHRAVMTALRARLWYEYAWDTALPAPLPERDEPRNAWLREYVARTAADLRWAQSRWTTDNLDGDFPGGAARLQSARESLVRLFPFSKIASA